MYVYIYLAEVCGLRSFENLLICAAEKGHIVFMITI